MSAWYAWDEFDEIEEINREIRLRQNLLFRFAIASVVTIAILVILTCGGMLLMALLNNAH